ncbi:MAG: porin [Thermoguttaceae bacterium]|nr:porin [Thermoguttaceae bacterium]MDW8038222.1 outer membrane beta-barrel protein [Thermoguttaceae bacterium]
MILVWGLLGGAVLSQAAEAMEFCGCQSGANTYQGEGYAQPAGFSSAGAESATTLAAEESTALTCLPPCWGSRRCCNGSLPDPWTLFPKFDSGLKIGGWISAGVFGNAWGARSNGPIGMRDVGDAFTSDQNWLFIDKPADTSCKPFDWGFRFDILFGADAPDTRAFRNSQYTWDNAWISSDDGVYGSAIPQLYAVVAWNKLSVKIGHFFTPMGYEGVPVTGNFFYSHTYCHSFGEPFTHTGVLATYEVDKGFNVHAGWTTAWDTAFDNPQDGQLFLGGVDVPIGQRITFTWMVNGGRWGERWGVDLGDLYFHSFVVKFTMNERWTYVFQHDMGLLSNVGGQMSNGQWYGIAQYLVFKINDCWSLGGRFEWFRDDDGLVVPGGLSLVGTDYYALTLGLNWKPHANLAIRPEIRYDWANGRFVSRPFNDGDDREQLSGGVDLIFTY